MSSPYKKTMNLTQKNGMNLNQGLHASVSSKKGDKIDESEKPKRNH